MSGHVDGFDQQLSDTTSHAYEAYMWMDNSEESLNELYEMGKLQRFGLATIYLSTAPELDWKIANMWTTHEHECGWFGLSCAITDTVTELLLQST